MKDNPYSKMIEIIKEKGSSNSYSNIQLGEVISSTPNLTIKINDLQIGKENILIADYLLNGHIRQYQNSNDGSSWGSTSYIKYIDSLKPGDIIATLPTKGKQTYIILARVVSL